jgi:hypothetical protein
MNARQPETEAEAAADSEVEFNPQGGPLKPSQWDEARRFPRFYYRARVRATVLPMRPGDKPVRSVVLTRDLSRGGVNLVHGTELSPGQHLEMVLNDGVKRTLLVQWCRRLGSRCFSVGCRFVKTADEGEAPAASNARS